MAMGLNWFIRAVVTQIVGQTDDSTGEVKIESVKMSNKDGGEKCSSGFQMPLHYPRYKKEDYMKMEEWKVDLLLKEYGLSFYGSMEEKRNYAMGTFLWPSQL
ncbi:hypothetical protein IHE45_15G004600 [Dioscorea alata]|uniref:Uncharacterized protein n=1 Tax=Dioscorea alata TaxID=55571 RepID=A0ACB7UJI1_DIOAL|nr:hypothetical protein IHE45_15G004600 [Dioscorea alata]